MSEKREVEQLRDRYIRDLACLGELFLARYALNQASPFKKLVLTHRMYHIVRLSGSYEILNKTMPLLADTAEKTASVFSSIETIMPFSVSDMLENMTSLDAWAMIGLMDLIGDVTGMRKLIGAIPGLSLLGYDPVWRGLQFAPFAFQGNLRFLASSNSTLANGTDLTKIPLADQANDKLMTAYAKDVAFLIYLLLATQALNKATPVLSVAAAHHVYQVIRLSNATEELKEKMPLLVAGMEKAASIYQKIEAITPSFFSGIFENMLSLDAWATAGLIDQLRGAPFLEYLIGKIPMLSYLSSDRRWQIARFAPFLIGSTLLTPLYSSVGLNFQQNLIR